MSDSKGDNGLDLSQLQILPDWVSSLEESEGSKTFDFKEFSGHEAKEERRGQHGKGGSWNRDRKSRDRPQRNRDSRGSGHDQKGGKKGDRDRQRRGGGRDRGSQRPQPASPPKGLSTSLAPTEAGIKALSDTIRKTGRTFALIDLAKLILAGRERYQIQFSPDKKEKDTAPFKLIRCKADGSVWLTREEAIRHFVNSDQIKNYYGVEEVETEAPKGNFSGIAVCGMSGTLLGPPNHHTYQDAVIRIHRERFSNLSLDHYKNRIRVENGEEIVEKWKSEQSKTIQYIFPKPEKKSEHSPETGKTTVQETETPDETPASPDKEPASNRPPEPETTSSENTEPQPETEAETTGQPADPTQTEEQPTAQEKNSPAPATEATPDPEPPVEGEPATTRLENQKNLEHHIRDHLAETLFVEVKSVTIPGNIPGKLLSSPLLEAVKHISENARRSPSIMIAPLCGRLGHKGLKLFRRQGKKLYVAAARPKKLDPKIILSQPLQKIVTILKETPKTDVKTLLRTLSPPAPEPTTPNTTPAETATETVTETTPPTPATEAKTLEKKKPERTPEPELTKEQLGWLKDLRWLIDEGYVLEYASAKIEFVGIGTPTPPEPKLPGSGSQKAKKENLPTKPKSSQGDPAPTSLADETGKESSLAATVVPVEENPDPCTDPALEASPIPSGNKTED